MYTKVKRPYNVKEKIHFSICLKLLVCKIRIKHAKCLKNFFNFLNK